jgi:hypothetical protein
MFFRWAQLPSLDFIKTGSGIRKLIRGLHTHTDRKNTAYTYIGK